MSQGKYWLLTIPHAHYLPYLPPGIQYTRGQLELSADTQYLHWQLLVVTERKRRLRFLCNTYGPFHAELSRSTAANDYVWKEHTRVEGTQFQIGTLPVKRNAHTDWDAIRGDAQRGRLDTVPADIYVRCYNQLRRIEGDFLEPVAIERRVRVYWGVTGSGKSRRAWSEAGLSAYPKDPRTKFWCAYRGHEHVVIDEFRGGIDIGHVLRWFDRYPVLVETKGSATVFSAKEIWITSNVHPSLWYPELDDETKQALLRRLEITEFHHLM